MDFKNLLAAALLGASTFAAAQNEIISEAYEIELSDFQAPAGQNGGVSFRTCESCDIERARVTPDTRYSVNGEVVDLRAFRKAILTVRDRDHSTVILLHHLESDTVISIDVAI